MFYVMEFVQGRIFWDPALPDVAGNSEREAIHDAMNATLAALHDVDIEAAGLGDYGKAGQLFRASAGTMDEPVSCVRNRIGTEMDRLIAWLAAHMPTDDGLVSLVHGDYRLDNIIFATDRPAVLAVLDWELSTLGHPYADVAYQCMQWRLPHAFGFSGSWRH